MPAKNSVAKLKPNNSNPILPSDSGEKDAPANTNTVTRKPRKPSVKRIPRGFQIEQGRAAKYDLLVAQMKNKSGDERRTGPELIDEALDYLFQRYLK